jgi:hypothetical protein
MLQHPLKCFISSGPNAVKRSFHPNIRIQGIFGIFTLVGAVAIQVRKGYQCFGMRQLQDGCAGLAAWLIAQWQTNYRG